MAHQHLEQQLNSIGRSYGNRKSDISWNIASVDDSVDDAREDAKEGGTYERARDEAAWSRKKNAPPRRHLDNIGKGVLEGLLAGQQRAAGSRDGKIVGGLHLLELQCKVAGEVGGDGEVFFGPEEPQV